MSTSTDYVCQQSPTWRVKLGYHPDTPLPGVLYDISNVLRAVDVSLRIVGTLLAEIWVHSALVGE